MSVVDRGEYPQGPLLERDGVLRAHAFAHATSQAYLLVDLGFLALVVTRIPRRDHAHGFDWTHVGALHAPGTFVSGNARQKVRRAYGLKDGKPFGGEHGFAAAAATVANEGDALADILAELYQVAVAGLRQQIAALCLIHAASDAVLDQRARRGIEGHADFHRRFAVATKMRKLVAAVTGADTDVRGRFDHLRSPFVVEHVQGIFRGQRALVDEGAPNLCFGREQRFDEVFLDVQVPVCLLYTSDAADEEDSVDLGGRRI